MCHATNSRPLLQLGSAWRFPVNIHIITPDDPLADNKLHRENVTVLAADGTLTNQRRSSPP